MQAREQAETSPAVAAGFAKAQVSTTRLTTTAAHSAMPALSMGLRPGRAMAPFMSSWPMPPPSRGPHKNTPRPDGP